MFSLFKKAVAPAKPKITFASLRPCPCGSSSYSSGYFIDLVNCDNCGAIYYLNVAEPKAKIVRE